MYVYGEGEKYELTRFDDRTFCWTPTKGAKNKRTQMEATSIRKRASFIIFCFRVCFYV